MYSYGDIFYANLPIVIDSQVQQGVRPVIIISNDLNNKYSPVVNVVPLTSRMTKHPLPTHVKIQGYGLPKPSVILGEQIITIDKKCLGEKVGTIIDKNMRNKINRALMTQLNMVA